MINPDITGDNWSLPGRGFVMKRDRREYPRAEIRWPVAIMTPYGLVDGGTKNIGVGGALISCEYPLPLHAWFCVIFKVSDHTDLAINTIVARSNITGGFKRGTLSEAALYYTELTSTERQFLRAKVSQWLRITSLERLSVDIEDINSALYQQIKALQDIAANLVGLDNRIRHLADCRRRARTPT